MKVTITAPYSNHFGKTADLIDIDHDLFIVRVKIEGSMINSPFHIREIYHESFAGIDCISCGCILVPENRFNDTSYCIPCHDDLPF